MNTIFYTLSVTWQEIQLMLKERGSLAIYFLLPLLLGAMMGSMNILANSGEEATILLHVCLVNEDADGAFGIEVSKAIESIEELEVAIYDTAAEAEEQVAQGDAAAAIIIPANFSQDIHTYTPTTIEVIVES